MTPDESAMGAAGAAGAPGAAGAAQERDDERAGARTDEQVQGPTGARTDEQAQGPDGARAEGPDGARAGGPVEVDGELTVRDHVSVPDAKGRPRRGTRRFPLFTKDTARPEGGGRAAPGDAPAPARQWPVLTVAGLVGLGLLLTALDVFRYGTLLIGLALMGGAVLRWFLPDVGMLAVRSRFTDIATYGVLGLAIVLLALMAQPSPLLEIPFLKDTLHFTVGNE
nr:DUF3017 domain-containing protein [Streptomyces sp. CRN 30]